MSDHVQQQPHHDAHKATPGHESPFAPAEWQEFRKSDVSAGRAVVVLMTAIFGIGLVLYTVVALVVAS